MLDEIFLSISDLSQDIKRITTLLSIIVIFSFLIILGLIFSVVFLYQKLNDKNSDIIPISIDNVGMDVFLGRNATNQKLVDIYITPNSNPFFNISFEYQNIPDGLSFRLVDENGTIVSENPAIIKNYEKYQEWKYLFSNTNSKKYTLQYSLSNALTNVSNVLLKRIEWKTTL